MYFLEVYRNTLMRLPCTLGPVITIALAVVILNESFTFNHAMGTVLVILGVVLLTIKSPNRVRTGN